ncbi:hypothetical protein PF010_g23732 [Phytophthora fragariae]|uniref:Uncharacterized protein n=1 Tax=Phytophthora fragariae TaxID=53985 RepID=A0A6G0K4L9_9STRA|nr:hypothetical protein PF010_g23732 [Phytophthora fragariae]KAE9212264.1 hypothetical protein PF004_g15679 [Phytophthora fragariae]KAE9293031.1 hypothetical protein PF008_g24910 [Phytophthora fragariae]
MAKTTPGGSCGPQSAVLGLPRFFFYFTWLVMLGFHSLCILYLVAIGVTYFVMTAADKASYAPLWSDTGIKHFKGFGAVYLVVAVLHVIQVLRILYLSIHNKRLVLHSQCSKSDECDSNKWVWGFDLAFAAREMVAIACLSFQAFQASKWVPRVGFNNLNAAILILACWLTPLTQILLHKSIALSRALSLLTSFVLCTFLAKVMQSLLFMDYADVFAMESFTFASKMIYDPTFLAVLAPENRMMFATTVGDYISRLLPLICSFVSLVMLEGVISRRDEKVTPSSSGTAKVDPNQIVTVETLDGSEGGANTAHLEAGESTKALVESRTAEHTQSGTLTSNPGSVWPFIGVKFSIVLWGILVLAFHLKAQSQHKTMPTGCFSATRPWFSSKVSCLAFVYDCAVQKAVSPTNEIMTAFNLDPEALGSLNFVNCPALMVPSIIQTFPQLHCVQIFNSALYAWGSDAALVQSFHPRLKSVVLISVKLAAFPEGLMGVLPSSLVNLQFFATSLPSVPTDLGTKWGGATRTPIQRVGFEYGMIMAVPVETFQLPVLSLSLAGNFMLVAIPELANLPAKSFLPQLTLDSTPLMALPATIDPTVTIGDLSMENTKMMVLPDWTQTQVLTKMHLNGSAFCLTTTEAQQEKVNGICSVSRWGNIKPQNPIDLLKSVYEA